MHAICPHCALVAEIDDQHVTSPRKLRCAKCHKAFVLSPDGSAELLEEGIYRQRPLQEYGWPPAQKVAPHQQPIATAATPRRIDYGPAPLILRSELPLITCPNCKLEHRLDPAVLTWGSETLICSACDCTFDTTGHPAPDPRPRPR